MKKFIFMVLFLGITLSSYGQVAGTTIKGQKPDGSFDWIKLDSDGKIITSGTSSGSSELTGTMTLILPNISMATTTFTLLATNTITMFQNVASFATGDLIMFQGRSRFYWSLTSNPTMTAAELQARGFVFEGNDIPMQLHMRTSANLALIADPSSVATFTYSIIKEQ